MRIWWNRLWPPFVAVLFFLTVWQLAVSLFHVEDWILPPPSDIVREAAAGAEDLLGHTLATLQLTLVGFAIGTAVGLVIALLLHLVPWMKTALYPLLVVSQNVPTIALAPLLMIWFGFGILPKVIVITLVCFFPVAVSAMDGLARTDRTMMNYMEMAGASKWQTFSKLELPHALPSIFSGVRIAATYSVMGAVIGEWIGSDKGIGYFMMLQKSAYRTDRVFVAIFIIVLLSLLMVALITLLERRLIRWNPKQEKSS
ncbi:ABC-type nitrate/sulfonate/bicarbonate transport system, permease component [Paenibacillus uliginis N3/975]|uniref:ABC-type nitrate/sulfonate/bicarbonate transport system, permease component n=1 Tax=Paenibacillus uliginis N3/975 TaxID=1313296 RepID=A0A1X7HR68_9BACL|nr:ABC transporter permease [Paenibacillus uliginis]SMF91475.1 ABC-type nitrate/sulfonate/bicarbonate transport system, permease component [Paenibacillus uliginis N3/975]